MSMQRKYSIIALIAIFIPTTALANVGIPLIFFTLPAMLIGLLPIIVIEAYIYKKNLNIPLMKAIISSATANTVTTTLGVPITSFVLMLLTFPTLFLDDIDLHPIVENFLAVTLQAPWMGIGPRGPEGLEWLVPTAILVLLIPFCLVSWQIEYFIVKDMNKQLEPPLVKSVCLRANIITYGLLALVPISMYFV